MRSVQAPWLQGASPRSSGYSESGSWISAVRLENTEHHIVTLPGSQKFAPGTAFNRAPTLCDSVLCTVPFYLGTSGHRRHVNSHARCFGLVDIGRATLRASVRMVD